MATITEILKQYRGQQAPSMPTTSQMTGSGEAVRRNIAAEAISANQAVQAGKAAGELSAQQTLIEEQRKQSGIQRDNQILQYQQQSTQERKKYEMQTRKVMEDLSNNREKLSQAEILDKMEASGSYLRLQDDKYRYELADVGRRSRLEDAISFDDSMKKAIFSDELKAMQENIAFKKMLDLDDAAFQKQLANMNIEMAIDLAVKEAKSSQTAAMYSAGGSAISTGIQAGMATKYKEPTKEEAPK